MGQPNPWTTLTYMHWFTSTLQETKVRRYNWRIAGFLGWPFPTLKY